MPEGEQFIAVLLIKGKLNFFFFNFMSAMENPASHGEWVLIFQKTPIVYDLGLYFGIMLCIMTLSFLTCV